MDRREALLGGDHVRMGIGQAGLQFLQISLRLGNRSAIAAGGGLGGERRILALQTTDIRIDARGIGDRIATTDRLEGEQRPIVLFDLLDLVLDVGDLLTDAPFLFAEEIVGAAGLLALRGRIDFQEAID